jgi:amino acid permease
MVYPIKLWRDNMTSVNTNDWSSLSQELAFPMELKQKNLQISEAFKKDNSKITSAQKNLLSVAETTKYTTWNTTLIYLCNYLFIHTYIHFFINESFIHSFIRHLLCLQIYLFSYFIHPLIHSSKSRFIKRQPIKYRRHETQKRHMVTGQTHIVTG